MLWRIGETLLLLAAIVAFVVFVEDGDWVLVVLFFVPFLFLKAFEMWTEGRAGRYR